MHITSYKIEACNRTDNREAELHPLDEAHGLRIDKLGLAYHRVAY